LSAPPPGLGPGVFFDIRFNASTLPLNQITSGVALVGTPEPGTLALLGTSVIGLAGMARRRFKLGK
jgi:hypothetical protein